jgi:terminase large subunit-like protein
LTGAPKIVTDEMFALTTKLGRLGASMLMTDLRRAIDPASIATDIGLTLDRWQADLMRSTAPRILLCCSRQVGKSTVSALIALSVAVMTPGALVLLISPSQRQSAELFKTVMGFLKKLPSAPRITAESVLRVELDNHSRIIALPSTETTIRGYGGASLIVVDEAARVPDELMAAIRPTLATKSDSRLICLSTPAGKRGWFFESWTGDAAWHRVKILASECPRITPEFLAEELRELGAQRFSEEYGLEFLEADDAVFPMPLIDAAFTNEVRPLWT